MMLLPLVLGIAAAAAHEANRQYCKLLGDHSQLPWDEAPEWQKASCLEGAEHAFRAWRERLPVSTKLFEESHKNWLAYKQLEGWTYGPVKDLAKKEHPCMVPYGELPEEQRMKDSLFSRTCYAVFSALLGE